MASRRAVGFVILALTALAACDQRASAPADPLEAQRTLCADPGGAAGERIAACGAVIDAASAPVEARVGAYVARGELRRAAGDPTAALRDFGAALDIAPDNADAKLGRAGILVASGQLDAAAPLLEEVIDAGRPPARAYALRGDMLYRYGDNGRAIAAFDEAIAADPSQARFFAARGLAKERSGDADGARDDFDQALRLDPGDAVARAGRCWSRVRGGGDIVEARADADAAVASDGALVSGRLCQALVLLREEQWDDARVAYDAVLAIEPANAAALFGRGFARRQSGEREEGAADIRRAYDFNSRVDREFDALGIEL
ncbi:MAG: tetratricopeptide repeat protein [Hyphomonadaceae bacterium]